MEVKKRIMLGNFVLSSGYFDAYYKKALQAKGLICQAFDDAFKDYDFCWGRWHPLRRCLWVRDCPTRWLCTWAIFIRL